MRHVSCARWTTGCFATFSASVFGIFAFWLLGIETAFAIPSPDLVVGSFVSISQLFALASAVLGGGAAYATVRMRSRGGTERASRSLLYVAVGLFILLSAAVGIIIYLYVKDSNAQQRRLEATLIRPMATVEGHSLDPALKEVTYSEQQRDPHGISTGDLEALLNAKARGERKDTFLLDIREAAETEMGSLPGATAVRFPDIKSSNIDFAGRTAVLFCHNGNRGYETCQALAAMGIDCRFLVGGLEKWLVERRPLTGLKVRTLADLRALPSYPNQKVLLDTPQVQELVGQGAVFIDARYPGEFASGHLPDAINLPVRSTPTNDFKARLSELPKKPIIIPCYDRRSCFFGEVLGLELKRAGYDYRGRYTLPWEYFTPSPPRPYIKQWLAESRKGWFAKAGEALAELLAPAIDHVGVIVTILLLACVSRLLVMPFSLKAERDHVRSRTVATELDEIKRRLKDDPVRKTRAVRDFYVRHNFTPGRNLLGALFLPIMAIAVLAVRDLVAKTNAPLLWIPDLSLRDPWLILPVTFATLITLYLDRAFATKAVYRLAIWLAALPLMTATGAMLGAGVDIYLIGSASLLMLQHWWVTGTFVRIWQSLRRNRLPQGVIALDEVSLLEGRSNKAYRLARMRAVGMPVPDGVLLTPEFLARFAAASEPARQRQLDWLWRRFAGRLLAVRSAAGNEDGANHSFAGVFESVTNVDRGRLQAAIAEVQTSFEAARVSSYMPNAGSGNLLLQPMVDAEYSGVLFTRDPSSAGLAMIEMVQGTAEKLVSGVVRPHTYRFGRITKTPYGQNGSPIDLGPLLALGDQAEHLFGSSQDIEWVYRGGCFNLVQSRDITRTLASDPETAAIQDEYARVIDIIQSSGPDEVVFGKNELSELLPRPTPLSLSLMEALWASGGSIDQAARELGLSYHVGEGSTYLVTIFGRLYVDKREEKSRALVIGARAARRLFRAADRIERDFREHFLPQFLKEIRPLVVADFDKLSSPELIAEIERLHDRFVHDTHVMVDVINIAASYYLARARQALSAEGRDPSRFLGDIPETFETHALAEIASTTDKSKHWLMLRNFGHRAMLDYELSEPRYGEDLYTLNRMIAGRVSAGRSPYRDTIALSKSQAKCIDIARRFQTLKEDAKHHSLSELAVMRRAVLALDRRFGFDGRIFYLNLNELLSLKGSNARKLRELASSRQLTAGVLRKRPSLPSTLTAAVLESASAGVASESASTPGLALGTRVSGSKVVVGRACVVPEDHSELGKSLAHFRDGDIIVAAMINPAWLPYFSRAGGFVSEVGGWLSHPAILAREYDVAMIVGTEGINGIEDGTLLKLHRDGRVETLIEEPMASQVAAE